MGWSSVKLARGARLASNRRMGLAASHRNAAYSQDIIPYRGTMDRLDELRLFLAIPAPGSLAGAGRRLGHSPPAVTRGLGALEERLGLRLLDRTTRRSRPTEAGERLAEQA